MTTSRGLLESIAVVNRMLEKRDASGSPTYQVDSKGCPRFVRGIRGGYRWPPADRKGGNENTPLKGFDCDNLDHLQDAGRYAKINFMRLLRAEIEAAKAPNLARSRSANPNPDRRR
jgi:hypothetical protein